MADDRTWSQRSRVYFKIYLLSGVRCGFYVVCEVSFWNNSFMFALLLLFLIRSLSDRCLMLNMCEVKQRVDESGVEGKRRDRQREEEAASGSSPALCCQRQSHFHFTPLGFPANTPPCLADRARLPVSENQNTSSGSLLLPSNEWNEMS